MMLCTIVRPYRFHETAKNCMTIASTGTYTSITIINPRALSQSIVKQSIIIYSSTPIDDNNIDDIIASTIT